MSANNPEIFSNVMKFLHWSIASLFLLVYGIVYYRHWFTADDTFSSYLTLHLHQGIGLSVIIFVIPRLYYRWKNPIPTPVAGNKWEHIAAKLAHIALYFFMIAMPLSGYIYAKYSTDVFGLFSITNFGETSLAHWLESSWGINWKESIRTPARLFHREYSGEVIVWILIVFHAGAALYHHYIKRDSVLLRMLPGSHSEEISRRQNKI